MSDEVRVAVDYTPEWYTYCTVVEQSLAEASTKI